MSGIFCNQNHSRVAYFCLPDFSDVHWCTLSNTWHASSSMYIAQTCTAYDDHLSLIFAEPGGHPAARVKTDMQLRRKVQSFCLHISNTHTCNQFSSPGLARLLLERSCLPGLLLKPQPSCYLPGMHWFTPVTLPKLAVLSPHWTVSFPSAEGAQG